MVHFGVMKMRYTALACDFDGTLASHDVVADNVTNSLARVAESGRCLVLVTGRMLDDLIRVFPDIDLFNRVVAEDGGVIYDPETGDIQVLAERPSEQLIYALRRAGVDPLQIGEVILATWQPQEVAAIEVVRASGSEQQIIFNRGAVMIVPPGVNKASGLRVALRELGISLRNTVGLGDAENDHAFLRECEFAVAVNDAVPMIRQEADLVMEGGAGNGVIELIDELLCNDLGAHETGQRHPGVRLGVSSLGKAVHLPPLRQNILISGPSGSGKSRAILGIVERAVEHGYQVCVIDPEGDYSDLSMLVSVGDEHTPPSIAEILQLIRWPELGVHVNLVALPFTLRPAFLNDLYQRSQALRISTGRPHWLIIDEAHHLIPVASDQETHSVVKSGSKGLILATVHPSFIARPALMHIDVVAALGAAPEETMAGFCQATGRNLPLISAETSGQEDALVWDLYGGCEASWIRLDPCRTQHVRHKRKYAIGDLGIIRSFYFRGPEGKLNSRAHNIVAFSELAGMVDDDTWTFHLDRGDYSQWIADVINDQPCARAIRRVESMRNLSSSESRQRVIDILMNRYTLPA
jgi:hydroxymethylpyrimidine pyrophosphatase-like HAD family hydrolase